MGWLIRYSQMIALLVLGACSGRSSETTPRPEGPATLQVENQGFADMVIYVVNGAQRVRLGMVAGNSTSTFPLPAYLVQTSGPLRFLADPIGGTRTPVSEEMTVQPGNSVTLTIPPQ